VVRHPAAARQRRPAGRQADRPGRAAQGAPELSGSRRPLGEITRGTTAPNRLRRVDRWLAAVGTPALLAASDPLVVDLGFGASPVTTIELYARLRRVRADVEVVGIEIDAARVAAAVGFAAAGSRSVAAGSSFRSTAGVRCWCGRSTSCGSTTSRRRSRRGAC
jgi:hypothetical protein